MGRNVELVGVAWERGEQLRCSVGNERKRGAAEKVQPAWHHGQNFWYLVGVDAGQIELIRGLN